MNKMYLLLSVLIGIGCGQNQQNLHDTSPKANDSATTVVDNKSGFARNQFKVIIDSLSEEEETFLRRLLKENEFLLIHKKVERYYSLGNNTLPVYSKIVVPKEVLQAKGYVFFEFTAIGKITDANLVYSYSLGQASTGFGSVVGVDPNDYIHTIKSCGLTTCIIQVFQNGTKIFEKDK